MLQLNNVKSGYSTGVINSNFQAIEEYINNYVLNRDGVVPGQANQMNVPLDMNSKNILNVGRMDAKEVDLNGIPIKELLGNIVEEVTQEADRAEQEADRAEREADRAEAATGANDAYLLNRANHTGTQGISTVEGLPAALSAKADQSSLDAIAASKVDKVVGKGLSEEDFTTALRNKLVSLNPGIESIVAGSGIAVDDSDPANPIISAIGNEGTEVNVQTGTEYTLVLSDAFKMVTMDNADANTLTVPPNSAVAFPANTRIDIGQDGAGQTTIVAGAGVTIRTPETLKLRKQWSKASLIRRDADVWDLVGDLEVEA